MKKVKTKLDDELRPEYDLKSLRVRKLGPGRKSFGTSVVRLEPDATEEDVVVPPFDAFMNPVLQALRELGGSGTIEEINNKVVEIMGLVDRQLEILHRGTQTLVENRLGFARSFLKKYGLIDNPSKGIWVLTAKGKELDEVDTRKVKRYVNAQWREKKKNLAKGSEPEPNEIEPEPDEIEAELSWKEDVLNSLLRMDPSAFERLVQRLLRESGFSQVEVTGRSGDGGIDGKGILRLNGLLSFHVIFQCKRYKGSVSPNHVRDLRGAMVSHADKGLLITTGNFTTSAIREATRVPAIDLIDGDQLVEKLKDLALGVHTEKVERITVDHDWFAGI